MSKDQTLDGISRKLTAILLVLLSPDIGEKTTAQKVALLVRLGLANQEIADMLGTSRGTVEVLKSRAKKGK